MNRAFRNMYNVISTETNNNKNAEIIRGIWNNNPFFAQ